MPLVITDRTREIEVVSAFPMVAPVSPLAFGPRQRVFVTRVVNANETGKVAGNAIPGGHHAPEK